MGAVAWAWGPGGAAGTQGGESGVQRRENGRGGQRGRAGAGGAGKSPWDAITGCGAAGRGQGRTGVAIVQEVGVQFHEPGAAGLGRGGQGELRGRASVLPGRAGSRAGVS